MNNTILFKRKRSGCLCSFPFSETNTQEMVRTVAELGFELRGGKICI